MVSFKEQYAALPPGEKREKLVYDYAIKQGKPKTVPVTVSGPNNIKITYNVMPDFLMIEGIRVTLTPITAQRIADHFNMYIPTAKMAKQIYNSSNKIPARPLSGSGVTIDGKYYSPQEVVDQLLSTSKANIAYNELVNSLIQSYKINPSKPIDGFNKTIVQSEVQGKTGYYGLWADKNKKPIQGGNGVTPHSLNQTEYCAGARLVDGNVTITTPDGKIVRTTIPQLLETKNLSALISFSTGKGVQRYARDKAGPPPGYKFLKVDPSIKSELESKAMTYLHEPMWAEFPFTLSNGKHYLAKLEPHTNRPKGVTVYEKISQPVKPSKSKEEPKDKSEEQKTPPKDLPRKSFMDRLTDFISSIKNKIL